MTLAGVEVQFNAIAVDVFEKYLYEFCRNAVSRNSE
jgi:hypothetical protein